MVSALAKGNVKIILDKSGKSHLFQISGGFIEVYENKVTVLLESATAL
jgi:F-type H+-transporting ATPase subunit epsilon